MYRKHTIVVMLSLLAFFVAIVRHEGKATERHQDNPAGERRIRLTFDGGEAIVTIRDHPISREFLSRLPMTLNFKDYIGKEKIGHLASKLPSDGSSPIASGDFAYYAPWGNLAIFYDGTGHAGAGLIILGIIESGKEALAKMTSDFIMTLVLVD